MNIYIRNLQEDKRIGKRRLLKCGERVLKEMGEGEAELSILLVSDSCIRSLNKRYRKVNAATDVLAFPMRGGHGFTEDCRILGDVVISLETAKRAAREKGIALETEMNLYLIHGILHLLGYDDRVWAKRKKMQTMEKKLMEVV